jgi:hypothetical protein
MNFIRLKDRPADWDLRIASFTTKTLFHEAVWLDFMLERHPDCRIHYYELRSRGTPVGYFCAVLKTRASLRLCESPDVGRGLHIGPVVADGVDESELIDAVVRFCREERLAAVGLCLDGVPVAAMEARGFKVSCNTSHVCSLEGGEQAAWERMHKTRRTSIRKAIKDGLHAEVTCDLGIVDEFFPTYVKALARKGIRPTFGPEQVRSLLRRLVPADRVLAVRVRREGRPIGTGFFLHDDKVMHFWDGASEPEALPSYPNDLLHWTAIQAAAARGITEYHMSSGPEPQPPNRFAMNFGCEQRRRPVYTKSFAALLWSFRKAYRMFAELSPRGSVVRSAAPLGTKVRDSLLAVGAGMMFGS